jgi:uncharacterized protein (DUF1778 family)
LYRKSVVTLNVQLSAKASDALRASAALAGCSPETLATALLEREAARMSSAITLSPDDFKRFLENAAQDEEPSPSLRKAAEEYRNP